MTASSNQTSLERSVQFLFLLGYRPIPLKNRFCENLELGSLLVEVDVKQGKVRNKHTLTNTDFPLQFSNKKKCTVIRIHLFSFKD